MFQNVTLRNNSLNFSPTVEKTTKEPLRNVILINNEFKNNNILTLFGVI